MIYLYYFLSVQWIVVLCIVVLGVGLIVGLLGGGMVSLLDFHLLRLRRAACPS